MSEFYLILNYLRLHHVRELQKKRRELIAWSCEDSDLENPQNLT